MNQSDVNGRGATLERAPEPPRETLLGPSHEGVDELGGSGCAALHEDPVAGVHAGHGLLGST